MAKPNVCAAPASDNQSKTRTCKTCGVLSTEVRFYRGVPTYCSDCWKQRVQANRLQRIEYYQAYDRARNDDPARVAMRRRYQKAMPKEERGARTRKWISNNQEKRRCHIITGNAIRDGKLKVQPCERCGFAIGVHAHHEDYSKPLEVTWLCRRCHGQRHREINEERRRAS